MTNLAASTSFIPRLVANDPGLTTLDLTDRMVTDLTASLIASALRTNKCLKTLILRSNEISNVGACAIASALLEGNDVLSKLDLSENENIDDTGGKALLETIKTKDVLSTVIVGGTRCSASLKEDIDFYTSLNAHPRVLCRGIKRLSMPDGDTVFHLILEDFRNEVKVYTEESVRCVVTAMRRFPWVKELSMDGCCRADALVEIVSEALSFHPSLEILSLANNRIGPRGIQALCDALRSGAKTTRLRKLNINDNEIGDDGADVLVRLLETNAVIESISCERNNVSPVNAVRLQAAVALNAQPQVLKAALPNVLSNDPSLTTLDFRGTDLGTSRGYFTNMGAKVISSALTSNGVVTSLDLSGNHLGPEGAKALSDVLRHNTTLRTLILSGNIDIGDEGARHLSNALIKTPNNTLTHLALDGCSVSGTIVEPMHFHCLLNRYPLSLKKCVLNPRDFVETSNHQSTIDLSAERGKLDVEAIRLIRNAVLRQERESGFKLKVTTVNLSHSPIGDDGARIVSEWLSGNSTVKNLSLIETGMTDEGAQALLKSLRVNTTLENIRVDYNPLMTVQASEALQSSALLNIHGSGVKLVVSKLRARDPGLVDVNLSHTTPPMRDDAARLFGLALLANDNVTTVDLSRNQIADGGVETLSRCLRDPNNVIESLDLSHNDIGSEGLKILADALINQRTLRRLVLSHNPRVDDSAAMMLWTVLATQRNTTLQELEVVDPKTGGFGACSRDVVTKLRVIPALNSSVVSLEFRRFVSTWVGVLFPLERRDHDDQTQDGDPTQAVASEEPQDEEDKFIPPTGEQQPCPAPPPIQTNDSSVVQDQEEDVLLSPRSLPTDISLGCGTSVFLEVESVAILSTLLPHLPPQTTRLDVSGNTHLTDASLPTLITAVARSPLTSLSFVGTGVTESGLREHLLSELTSSLQKVTHVDLVAASASNADNDTTEAAAISPDFALHVRSLCIVNMYSPKTIELKMKLLRSSAMPDPEPTTLMLKDLDADDDLLEAVVYFSPNYIGNEIAVVDLSGNNLTDSGAALVVELLALVAPTLRCLDLRNNPRLTPLGIDRIVKDVLDQRPPYLEKVLFDAVASVTDLNAFTSSRRDAANARRASEEQRRAKQARLEEMRLRSQSGHNALRDELSSLRTSEVEQSIMQDALAGYSRPLKNKSSVLGGSV